MTIDLTCPIEILSTDVTSDDRGRCRGYIDILNVSERTIKRVEGHVSWLNHQRLTLAESDVVFEGMSLSAHARAQLTVAGEVPAAQDIVFLPTRIMFSDSHESWDSDSAQPIEYDFTPEPPGTARDRLRSIAGRDALCYPQMRGDNWLCVCGRLNPAPSHHCARCMRSRDRMFAVLRSDSPPGNWNNFSLHLQQRERLEEKRAELRLQADRARHQKRERRIRTALTLLFSLISAATLILVGIFLGYIAF